ncbi:hypothetical protein D9M71_232730 [compost metagenome]
MWAEPLGLHPDGALAAQQLADFMAGLAGDDGHVQILALHQLTRAFAMHLDLDQRVGLGKAGENAGQKAHGIVIRGADPHHADHVRHAQSVEHLAMQFENALGVAEQNLAFGGQAHLTAVTLEQLALDDVLFQAFHLHAHRRLGTVDHFTGTGETTVLGDGDEGAQDV